MRKVKCGGKKFVVTEASCSCCGASPGEFFIVVRAGLIDEDGIYFPYLCCELPEKDGSVIGGCLQEILSVQDSETVRMRKGRLFSNALREVLGEDEDGITAEMEDLGFS